MCITLNIFCRLRGALLATKNKMKMDLLRMYLMDIRTSPIKKFISDQFILSNYKDAIGWIIKEI